VAGRELVFSNPEVVRLAKEAVVPYAGDQWYLHRQKDADGRFFWKVAQQGHRKNQPEDTTRQGIYVATADGSLLASDHFHPSAERMVTLLQNSLERWKQRGSTATVADAATDADRNFERVPPAGGLILNVFTRIPRAANAAEEWTPNHATGRDHVWLTQEEWRTLLPARWQKGMRFPVPRAITERLARFHLVDNVRGEPPFWTPEELRQAELTLVVEDPTTGLLRLEGSAHLETKGADRGYQARLQGYLQFDRQSDRFRRFDLLSWGEAWGEGPYTRRAPKGRFPLLAAFSLAGNTPADRVPPQASRNIQGYFQTGQ
jgi:hypothetical protein